MLAGLKCMDCEADIWFHTKDRIYYCRRCNAGKIGMPECRYENDGSGTEI
jgi:primosomal protein N'